jgi:hypothetical protein
LESCVSCFLEEHVIVERENNQIIDLLFEVQQSLGEFQWVLQVLFVAYQFLPFVKNIWTHAVDDVLNGLRNSNKHRVHSLKLVTFSLFEHVSATCLHLC